MPATSDKKIIYKQARAALNRLEKANERMYPDWVLAAQGFLAARVEALEMLDYHVGEDIFDTDFRALGRPYMEKFGDILRRERLDKAFINSTTRADLFKLLKHRPAIEAYRDDLKTKGEVARLMRLNHPSSILENWERDTGQQTPLATKQRRPKQLPTTRNRQMPMTPVPLIEGVLPASPSGKPSVEEMVAKAAAEAEAEAARLAAEEDAGVPAAAELVGLRSENEELRAEVGRLKATLEAVGDALERLAPEIGAERMAVTRTLLAPALGIFWPPALRVADQVTGTLAETETADTADLATKANSPAAITESTPANGRKVSKTAGAMPSKGSKRKRS